MAGSSSAVTVRQLNRDTTHVDRISPLIGAQLNFPSRFGSEMPRLCPHPKAWHPLPDSSNGMPLPFLNTSCFDFGTQLRFTTTRKVDFRNAWYRNYALYRIKMYALNTAPFS